MRTLLLVLLLVPLASAGLGPYTTDGWPIDADGHTTNPDGGETILETESRYPMIGDPLNQVAGNTVYPYWPLLTAEVTRMAADHPDRVRLHSAGSSTLGLDLYMLEIANFEGEQAENFIPFEDREVVWIDGGTHSNEYSGVYFTLAWAQYLVEEYGSDEFATWVVDNRHTWIMPLVNPDGSNAFGRLNANLVNINRNYPVVWDGQGNDAFMNNRGPSPASEIETQINIAWFESVMPDYYASIHCCGNLWLYPYGEQDVDPVDEPMLSRICDEVFTDVRSDCGPIWSTIYPASGSSVDTAYEMTAAASFGFEMSGRGAVSLWGQPVTFDDVRTQERESWAAIEHAFANVHLYGAHPNVTGSGNTITIQNDGWGNMTNSTAVLMQENLYFEVALNLTSGSAIEVPVQLEDGPLRVVVEYQKRLETKNIVAPSTGRYVTEFNVTDGQIMGEQSVQSGNQTTPAIGIVALLGVLAVAARRYS